MEKPPKLLGPKMPALHPLAEGPQRLSRQGVSNLCPFPHKDHFHLLPSALTWPRLSQQNFTGLCLGPAPDLRPGHHLALCLHLTLLKVSPAPCSPNFSAQMPLQGSFKNADSDSGGGEGAEQLYL